MGTVLFCLETKKDRPHSVSVTKIGSFTRFSLTLEKACNASTSTYVKSLFSNKLYQVKKTCKAANLGHRAKPVWGEPVY